MHVDLEIKRKSSQLYTGKISNILKMTFLCKSTHLHNSFHTNTHRKKRPLSTESLQVNWDLP